MTAIGELSRENLAALISGKLLEHGIDVVLTGGSCVSIYSSERYVSFDLDFVDISLKSNRKIGAALKELGFQQASVNSRHFAHPDAKLTVEFPSAPLMIGDEHIKPADLAEIETDCGKLRMLTPTDCVKDRLANFYYFKDRQCLEQAVLVASAHPINWASVKAWHLTEAQGEEFEKFRALI